MGSGQDEHLTWLPNRIPFSKIEGTREAYEDWVNLNRVYHAKAETSMSAKGLSLKEKSQKDTKLGNPTVNFGGRSDKKSGGNGKKENNNTTTMVHIYQRR